MSTVQSIQESLKGLSAEELLVIIAAAAAEAKKAVKSAPKKEAKEKKGSMPKGKVPPQLEKPRAWVDYVLAHANANGWPAITVKGQDEPLPASVHKENRFVFESTDKPLNNKQAMSLSKQYWDRKESKGERKELYEAFDAEYARLQEAKAAAAPVEEKAEEKVEEQPKKKAAAPTKSDEEKAAEKEAEKEAKALKKAADKEAEKEAKALKKAAEKEAAKPAPKPVSKPEPKPLSKPEEKKEESKETPKKKKKEEPKETAFECADDGLAHKWDFKGKKFVRDFHGNVWECTADSEAGDWAGKFDAATNTIDASAEEPLY